MLRLICAASAPHSCSRTTPCVEALNENITCIKQIKWILHERWDFFLILSYFHLSFMLQRTEDSYHQPSCHKRPQVLALDQITSKCKQKHFLCPFPSSHWAALVPVPGTGSGPWHWFRFAIGPDLWRRIVKCKASYCCDWVRSRDEEKNKPMLVSRQQLESGQFRSSAQQLWRLDSSSGLTVFPQSSCFYKKCYSSQGYRSHNNSHQRLQRLLLEVCYITAYKMLALWSFP